MKKILVLVFVGISIAFVLPKVQTVKAQTATPTLEECQARSKLPGYDLLSLGEDCYKNQKVLDTALAFCDRLGNIADVTQKATCLWLKSLKAQPDPSITVTPSKETVGPCIGANCTYDLLEPLPGLKSVDANFNIGTWVNTMVRIIIGIIGILAVVMIVIGGIQYMTTDAIGKKESGKETIQGAIFGVVLALGAYLLLRTINPQLVSIELQPGTAKTGQVSVAIADEVELEPQSTSDTFTGSEKITGCEGGIVNANTANGIIAICASIKTKLENMVTDAKKDGIVLFGGGYRDTKRQIELRKKNCGTTNFDIYEKSPSKCSPQTAIPGRSNHEKGLAIDFKNIPKNTCSETCKWLQKNAAKYGFLNDYKATQEYWHWSTTGR